MADVVKKVVVENVPKIYGSGYTIRYRVVSEDRNRTSHWSPMHTFQKEIPETAPPLVDGEIIFISERQVSATWEETNTNTVYEVFIKWDFEDNYLSDSLGWNYIRTVSTPTYNTLVPIDPETDSPAQGVRIWVQQPTSNQVYTEKARIFSGQDPVPS